MKSIAVIVLGNKLQEKHLHPELKGRMDVGIKVFKDKHAEYLILSGGKSNPAVDVSEAEVMRKYALEKGVPMEKVILEEESLDTIGNAYFTRKMVDNLRCSDIYVVSSCYHMKRTEYIFKMCYGENYNLFFNSCYLHDDKKAEYNEKNSIKLAEGFFRDIAPGDMNEIRRRLFSIHNLYKN